jgi:uncharacterized protein (DUF1015 family)
MQPAEPETFGCRRRSLVSRRIGLSRARADRASLDVSLLQDRLLAPILAVGDPRTDARIDFVGGVRGLAELERRVQSGRAAVAFALHPTRMEQLMAVAMPAS